VPLGGLPVLYCVRSPPTPGTYHLSLHDALPICLDVAAADGDRVADRRRVAVVGDRQVRIAGGGDAGFLLRAAADRGPARGGGDRDRKSTRLNSSHVKSSYAGFCLKNKTTKRWRR